MSNDQLKTFAKFTVLFGIVGFLYLRRELNLMKQAQVELVKKATSLGVRG